MWPLSALAPLQPQALANLQIGGGTQVVAAYQFAYVVAVETARNAVEGVATADGVVAGGLVLRFARRRVGRSDLHGRRRQLRRLQLVGQRNPFPVCAGSLVRALQESRQVEAGSRRLHLRRVHLRVEVAQRAIPPIA